MPLKIAFIHYHLRPGGVTRVIESAAQSLAGQDAETVALIGERPQSPPSHNVRLVEGLGYAAHQKDAGCNAETLCERLIEAARLAFNGALPDVWHIHNHSLGKNALFPAALRRLLSHGIPALLQIHDFAEDSRPDNYRTLEDSAAEREFNKTVYPVSCRIHYAALTRRDLGVLRVAGAPVEQSHLLPNPVGDSPIAPTASTSPPQCLPNHALLTLYPVRGIRRKNIGEFLLWSTLAVPREVFALTLEPVNPSERTHYLRWKNYAETHSLPTVFSAGKQAHFNEWTAAANKFITTSVAEGFGMAFLEPFLHGKPLVGRNLPLITSDFQEAGVNLHSLYPHLGAPRELINLPELSAKVDAALRRSFDAYRTPLPDDATKRAIAGNTLDGTIDFGFLDESLQRGIIDQARTSHRLRETLFSKIDRQGGSPADIERNRRIVAENFSLESYGERLLAIYGQLIEAPPSDVAELDSRQILRSFLSPEKFTLLRA